ncbi:epoxide hydrolase N-terminal domain-containing protein [Hymenobacter sp.]|uniref:epoxide hydrolase N-terminal domain-containing protein n=1 Tax=Hymenobacter sp. TaxID=1898978 RepID=UPI002869F33A|nr:epoxide hydrolase N-terminal domain-containing protein [Hymenobacter sp.]
MRYHDGRTRWLRRASDFHPEPVAHGYGTNPQYLRELVNHWQTRYDWRQHEAALNRFTQLGPYSQTTSPTNANSSRG